MLKLFNKKLRRLCSRLGWPGRRRSRPKIVVKKFGKSSSRTRADQKESLNSISSAVIHPSNELGGLKPIMWNFWHQRSLIQANHRTVWTLEKSRSSQGKILAKFAKSRLRVSINLPDNEISLKRSGQLSFEKLEDASGGGSISKILKGKTPLRSNSMFTSTTNYGDIGSTRTVVEVLRELNADVLALQDVKAEEEKNMKPLSDLAAALGMNYVFAESWAPEYGNAILSKWPIKRWKAQKIFDDTDFRNVLKATIDVPQAGEINFFCTLLDHLDENWRMKQINSIIQSTGVPHILAGGLNALDETDYSQERWTDIVKVNPLFSIKFLMISAS
ncbi:UNVERIFIED_CONTAM: hypothetical protein Slati_0585900 [Sesamum latifolium]|uniref:Endonuclease/exonuclease/phosphatase domain-containing protein n=1 Tax=Sesamum latifolium TaxID=2727402 RepID=A0AAW2Y1H0_9LAMI